ncbi:MAG: PIN domain-containing protein [Chthoniobacterales bacterium]|nr:PIN domain-containing protein [Chthoniobacterales bacterium]
MIAVDTNILVYAHREEFPFHSQARKKVIALAESSAFWAIPWPCVHEFLAICTNARIFKEPTEAAEALDFLETLASSPSLLYLSETEDHLQILGKIVKESRVQGGRIHDARIAAICLGNAVSELWTADRDFSSFRHLVARNPLLFP